MSAPASFHVVCSLSSSSTDSSTSDFIATEHPFNSANVVIAGGSPLDSISNTTLKSPSSSDVGSFVMSTELKLSNNELEEACWEPGRGVAERQGTPHPQGTSDLLQSYH